MNEPGKARQLIVGQSGQRMRLRAEQIPLAVIEWDLGFHVTRWNPGAKRVFGYTEQEALGQHYSFIIPAPVEEQVKKEWATLLNKQGGERSTNENITKDGRRIWCEWYNTSLIGAEGQVVGFASLAEDITDRKRAEEQSSKNEAILRATIESLPFDFFAIGSDGRYALLNTVCVSNWRAVIGTRPEDISPDDATRSIWLDNNRRAFAGQVVTGEVEFRVRGETRFFHNIIAPIRQGEEVIGILGVNVDITDRKRAERALQEAKDQLEVRVRKRTAELVRANEVLQAEVEQRHQAEEELKREQQALRRMVLASDCERRLITYELHDGVAQQLLGARLLFESQRPRGGRKSNATDAYRDAMAALTQATLELRRVMNWVRTPVLDKFGLVEAIEEVAAQLRLRPASPQIECRQTVRFKRLEPILENTIFRIAQEALTNACRHSRSGKVQVKLTQKGDDVTLEVRDWGIGFDQATVQENCLGLNGIRERCRILGGMLSVTSKPGNGTVVRAKFRLVEAFDSPCSEQDQEAASYNRQAGCPLEKPAVK